MIIKVIYNKQSQELNITSDVGDITVNQPTTVDTPQNLTFEIAVNTSEYEQIHNITELE